MIKLVILLLNGIEQCVFHCYLSHNTAGEVLSFHLYILNMKHKDLSNGNEQVLEKNIYQQTESIDFT